MTLSWQVFMRVLGVLLASGLYALLSIHVYAFFSVICTVLKKRLGTEFGLLWIAIGLCLLYNIIFNHFFAMTIKAGSPRDLERIEKMRKDQK